MQLRNWRLEQLLRNRRGGSLREIPWPTVYRCVVVKSFVYRGQQLVARDQFKHIEADVIELEAAEARELQTKGLVAAYPAADRLRCGPDVTGWRPWRKEYAAPKHDWNGNPLDSFDDCLLRISSVNPIGRSSFVRG